VTSQGTRKPLVAMVGENTKVKGSGSSRAMAEDKPVVGEKAGLQLLADKLTKGAMEVGASLEAIVSKAVSPMKQPKPASMRQQPMRAAKGIRA
jgi:hypothetical protein